MGGGELESIYQCKLPFEASRIQAAAIYCSDGRFGEHMDDFLHNALKLPRYDRLTIPGGVACLGGHFRSFREEDALLAHLRFLIAVHRLRRVVLIAHEECAFYSEGLHLPAAPGASATTGRRGSSDDSNPVAEPGSGGRCLPGVSPRRGRSFPCPAGLYRLRPRLILTRSASEGAEAGPSLALGLVGNHE